MTDKAMISVEKGRHSWYFRRMGGFDQVLVQSGADLMALDQLDQKLWLALSCPTKGLEFDSKTLALVDADGDGRIRASEIIAAVKWAGSLLKNPDDLLKGESQLPLAAINDSSPEGKQLLASAKQILVNLGREDATSITREDTCDATRIFSDTQFNGDGVITVDSTDSDAVKGVIEDIQRCIGSEQDRSCKPGINQEHVDRFFAEAVAYSEWWRKAEDAAANILPLGKQTVAAAASLKAVQEKIDDYFTRCRLAEFDGGAAAALNPGREEYGDLCKRSLSVKAEEIACFPIARVEAGKPLPLKGEINPAWMDALSAFNSMVVEPLLGEKANLSGQEWKSIDEKFAPYRSWLGEKVGEAVEELGLDRVREVLSKNFREEITVLIEKDKALEEEANEIASVEKLLHYYENLFTLVRNFVSFRDFYELNDRAIFQAGTLYLDGRSCDLCVQVEDVAKHSSLASLGRIYLAYCACTRNGGSEKMHIAAAFTDGDADNLRVGRNGVFYDRKGCDWDATIENIIEHPISIRQAFWAPYKRFARMVAEQIEKVAAAREKAVDAKAAAGLTDISKKTGGPLPTPEQTFDIAKFAGVFAAIGLAIGAIGTAIASVVTGILAMKLWKMPLALGGLVLLISGPSMVIAYLKLHTRNLAPILDANGWAVNARALINIPFGNKLTRVARLPKGAQRSLQDPFAEKKGIRRLLILMLLITVFLLLWEEGYLALWLEELLPTLISP